MPEIISAAYDAESGSLTVNGIKMVKYAGPNNDIDVTKLTIRGDGGQSYTLTNNT